MLFSCLAYCQRLRYTWRSSPPNQSESSYKALYILRDTLLLSFLSSAPERSFGGRVRNGTIVELQQSQQTECALNRRWLLHLLNELQNIYAK